MTETTAKIDTNRTGPRPRSKKVWLGTLLSSALFLASGLAKLAGLQMIESAFERWNYPEGSMYIVGIIEVAAAILILPRATARFGFGLLMLTMCGAIVTHVVAGQLLLALVPLALLVFIAYVATKDRTEQEHRMPRRTARRRSREQQPTAG